MLRGVPSHVPRPLWRGRPPEFYHTPSPIHPAAESGRLRLNVSPQTDDGAGAPVELPLLLSRCAALPQAFGNASRFAFSFTFQTVQELSDVSGVD